MARKRKTTRKTAKKRPPVLRVPNFQKFYATNVQGGATTQDFRIELMNEKLKEHDEWHLVSDAMVILTPTAAKRLLNMLQAFVETHEKEHGKIPVEFPAEKTY